MVSVAVDDAGAEGEGRDPSGAGKAARRGPRSQGATLLRGAHHG